MNRQAIFAIGLMLIVSFNLCLTAQTNIKIGKRQNGDRLLDTDSKSFQWSTPQNVKREVTYSTANRGGARITQLEFNVETDNNNPVVGSVLSGGEGKKDIRVLLEATGVTHMKYTVQVFGNSAALMPSITLITSFVLYIIYVNKQ